MFSRWEFGRIVLSERKGKQLPPNRMAELCALTGKSDWEIKARARFAPRFADRTSVEALPVGDASPTSWPEIVKACPVRTSLNPDPDEPEDDDYPEPTPAQQRFVDGGVCQSGSILKVSIGCFRRQ